MTAETKKKFWDRPWVRAAREVYDWTAGPVIILATIAASILASVAAGLLFGVPIVLPTIVLAELAVTLLKAEAATVLFTAAFRYGKASGERAYKAGKPFKSQRSSRMDEALFVGISLIGAFGMRLLGPLLWGQFPSAFKTKRPSPAMKAEITKPPTYWQNLGFTITIGVAYAVLTALGIHLIALAIPALITSPALAATATVVSQWAFGLAVAGLKVFQLSKRNGYIQAWKAATQNQSDTPTAPATQAKPALAGAVPA